MKLLLTADLHIGRGSVGLPPSMEGVPLDSSCRAAWGRIVSLAIGEKVDAVLIAGDLVEDSTAYYESLGPLVDGFKRLSEADVRVFAVGGNHDARAFERIAKDTEGIEGVNFVGRRGAWERVPLSIEGENRLWIEGWSFPYHVHPSSPIDGRVLDPVEGLPVVGLLHADLGKVAGPYAPVAKQALLDQPVDFWLLGHIHKPWLEKRDGKPAILYPGSPQAMDFGETGWHGVWIMEIVDGRMSVTRRQLSTVLYDYLTAVLDDAIGRIETREQADELAEAAIRAGAEAVLDAYGTDQRGDLRCVVHRCLLEGECRDRGLVDRLRARLPDLALPERHGVFIGFSGDVDDRTTLPLDLDSLTEGDGPVARLARALVAVESGEWREHEWLRAIHSEICAEYVRCRLEGDDETRDDGIPLSAPPDEAEFGRVLATQVRRLLAAALDETS